MSDLNDRQREAVEATEGPVLVLAGAGSGKTTVLTERVAYLIQSGKAKPWEILSITFTNKAAREMRDRITSRLDFDIRDMWVCTMHAMCVRMLRRFGDYLGYNRNFVIYDESDTERVIRQILDELGLKGDEAYKERRIANLISSYKNAGCDGTFGELVARTMESQAQTPAGDRGAAGMDPDLMQSLYDRYQERLHGDNAMDFDDLLVNTLTLLRTQEEPRTTYQNQFRYILIDEYQDTNPLQYEIIKILSEGHGNIFAVGDDDQSIYSFRGADIGNILEFERDYPGTKVIRLEQNYRSTAQILAVANSIIAHNQSRMGKTLWSSNAEGELPIVHIAKDEREEASFICSDIRTRHEVGEPYSNFAVLYRANSVSRVIEEKLRNNGIPYRVYGGLAFYDRKEIKDMIAYLSIIANPVADVHLLRILNTPKRGIGQMKMAQLDKIVQEQGLSYLEALRDAHRFLDDKVLLKKADEFWAMYSKISDDYQNRTVEDVVRRTYEYSGYKKMLEAERTTDAQSRMENIGELISAAAAYDADEPVDFVDFLQGLTLMTDQDSADEAEEAVTLMTVHRAKGLEYDTVYVAGMVDSVFPNQQAVGEGQVEEERRLAYVAATRAKRRLALLGTHVRRTFGRPQQCAPSRFLDEIPEDQRAFSDPQKEQAERQANPRHFFTGNASSRKAQPERKFFTGGMVITKAPHQVSEMFEPGMRVRHKMFGEGTVIEMLGDGQKRVAVIRYDGSGEKQMYLAYTDLEIIPGEGDTE